MQERHKKSRFDSWVGKIPEEDSLQYSCLENPMDRGAGGAIVHRVAKNQTQMKQISMHAYIYICACTYISIIHMYIYVYVCIYIYIYTYIIFQILFHYGLLQDTVYSSLCYTVGSFCLFILYILEYIYIHSAYVILHLSFPNCQIVL